MSTLGNKRKSEQLGMNFGTANSQLKKKMLLDVLKRHGENICFRCGQEIQSVDDLTLEHKLPWLGISTDLFWDLDNIAFSHLVCNSKCKRLQPRRHGSPASYNKGCRCNSCTGGLQAHGEGIVARPEYPLFDRWGNRLLWKLTRREFK